MTRSRDLKIALVHDWLTGMRGGEKVLEVLCQLFPQADLFTLIHNPQSVSKVIESHSIITSFINRLPLKTKRYRRYLPLFPAAVELFNLKDYDLIISTSHCVAKGIRTPPGSLHISYLHSPMRYVWDMYEEYFGKDKIGKLQQMIIPFFANYLRIWDVTSSNRVDYFIANSSHVAKRIRKYYRREATVIHPPVDVDFFKTGCKSENFFLIISALVPYKKVELAVRVFNRLQKPLYIFGSGPEKRKLAKLGGDNIRFFGWASPEKLKKYAETCQALIFPGEEDFGIVPLEIQSCGKPVIAYRKGGALETVIGYNGTNEQQCTGVFFEEQTEEALLKAIEKLETLVLDPQFIRAHAQKFNRERFVREIKTFIDEKVQEFFT